MMKVNCNGRFIRHIHGAIWELHIYVILSMLSCIIVLQFSSIPYTYNIDYNNSFSTWLNATSHDKNHTTYLS